MLKDTYNKCYCHEVKANFHHILQGGPPVISNLGRSAPVATHPIPRQSIDINSNTFTEYLFHIANENKIVIIGPYCASSSSFSAQHHLSMMV